MKSYTFAPIAAREYPTVKILDNPYIWGGVDCCINLSEKPYSPELEAAMSAHGIEWRHLPISEEDDADWCDALNEALTSLQVAYREGMKMVVHCDGGNNRSRTFVEAFYFMLMGQHYHDEYKGEYNHFIYNCKIGHLPEKEIESLIESWTIPFDEELELQLPIDDRRRLYVLTKNGTFVDIALLDEEIKYINKKLEENPERYQYAEGITLALKEMRREKQE